MDIIQTIILSLVEGITEFLPISSTGHLILAAKLLSIPQTDFVKSFEIAVQTGAIMSIVFLYARRFSHDLEAWKKIIAAFIPTGILGLLLYKFVKTYLLGNFLVVVVSLLLGGLALILIEKYFRSRSDITDFSKLSYKQAAIVGLGQSLAIIPGVSRAAATIVTGLFLGMSRPAATEFSFVLAVPTMIAATGLDLVKSSWHFSSGEFFLLGIGFLGAFLSALVTVKFLIGYVQKNNFIPFGVYRIVIALLALKLLV